MRELVGQYLGRVKDGFRVPNYEGPDGSYENGGISHSRWCIYRHSDSRYSIRLTAPYLPCAGRAIERINHTDSST